MKPEYESPENVSRPSHGLESLSAGAQFVGALGIPGASVNLEAVFGLGDPAVKIPEDMHGSTWTVLASDRISKPMGTITDLAGCFLYDVVGLFDMLAPTALVIGKVFGRIRQLTQTVGVPIEGEGSGPQVGEPLVES